MAKLPDKTKGMSKSQLQLKIYCMDDQHLNMCCFMPHVKYEKVNKYAFVEKFIKCAICGAILIADQLILDCI